MNLLIILNKNLAINLLLTIYKSIKNHLNLAPNQGRYKASSSKKRSITFISISDDLLYYLGKPHNSYKIYGNRNKSKILYRIVNYRVLILSILLSKTNKFDIFFSFISLYLLVLNTMKPFCHLPINRHTNKNIKWKSHTQ